MKNLLSFLVVSCLFLTPQVFADYKIILINKSALPFSLSPSNFSNSPSNFSNSRSNFSNGPSGNRRLLQENGRYAGYYVPNGNNLINFFNSNGERIAFNPNLDKTKSLFISEETGWCGTFTSFNGENIIGLIPDCYYRFVQD